jgi:hypothetical protein
MPHQSSLTETLKMSTKLKSFNTDGDNIEVIGASAAQTDRIGIEATARVH